MEKYFVTYAQSLALKELGFNEPCFAYYQKSAVIGNDTILPIQIMDKASNFNDFDYSKIGVPFCSAPLKSQVFEWFRKKYNINMCISWRDDLLNYDISLTEMKKGGYFYYKENFNNYGEAESDCIDKVIKAIKNG